MNEIAVSFGPGKHLSGTLALPDELGQRDVGFLMLNAGVIHRIGPHRFNVKLARRLASQGWPSLRFDLAGQGDSDNAPQAQPFDRQIVADLRAAMDHLERTTGLKRFVIAGICSGAHRGLAVAQEDERVMGLWMLDGYAYPSSRSRLQRYLLQWRRDPAATLRAWAAWPLRLLATRLSRPAPAADGGEPLEIDYGHSTPAPDDFAAMLDRMDRRGGRVFLMHTGGMLWRYSYAQQFHDVFGDRLFAARVRCDFLPDIDHTLTTLSAQRRVIDAIAGWACEVFGAQDAASKQKPA